MFLSFLFICLFVFEGEHELGGTEREGDTESKVDSRLRAVSTEFVAGLELMNCEIVT